MAMDAILANRLCNRRCKFFCAVVFIVIFGAVSMKGQAPCLSAERIAALKAQIANRKDAPPNERLKNDILNIKLDVIRERSVPKKEATPDAFKQKVAERLCLILSSETWPVKTMVGPEASSVWINLVRNFL